MTTQDWIGLALSYIYASGLLVLAEVVRRWRGYPQEFTRKLVHVGAGMWVFGVLALFDSWYIGSIPFATFIVVNYILWRYRLLEAMDAPDSSPGTVYFALAISILCVIFWRKGLPGDQGHIAAAGTMAMTWGDAMAALLGRRFGRHRYTIMGSTRSGEGSAAMFAASAAAIFPTLLLVPDSPLGPTVPPLGSGLAFGAALVGGAVAAASEAVSPHGTDNLSVPLLTAGAVFIVVTAFG